MGGKEHTGTLTYDGDVYNIVYNDSQKAMIADIDGDELRIYTADGNLEFIFVAK